MEKEGLIEFIKEELKQCEIGIKNGLLTEYLLGKREAYEIILRRLEK